MTETPSCPYCGASSTIRKGHRRTKTLGKRHIRRCKACGRKFTVENLGPTTIVARPDMTVAKATEPDTDEGQSNALALREEDRPWIP